MVSEGGSVRIKGLVVMSGRRTECHQTVGVVSNRSVVHIVGRGRRFCLQTESRI